MESDESAPRLYSIQFRLQRVTIEHAFVTVPVTSEVMVEGPDGKGKLDVAKLTERAVEISRDPGVKWYVEKQGTTPHPIQRPMEPGEEKFYGQFPQ
jgi:hypothetical protein